MDTTKLQPFDLERAKAGDAFCNAEGYKYTYLGVVPNGRIAVAYRNGYTDGKEAWGVTQLYPDELRMLPRKVKRWHVIRKGEGFCDESAARKYSRQYPGATIIEHEWEE